jgi:transposase, IS5 family
LTTKRTRKREFSAQMGRAVPSAARVDVVVPCAPAGQKGRPRARWKPCCLRIHFMHQWFTLSDPAMEEAPHDTLVLREFAGLGWGIRLPNESSILRFRHPLEKHKLDEQRLAMINNLLRDKGLLVKAGTVVDVTLISAD